MRPVDLTVACASAACMPADLASNGCMTQQNAREMLMSLCHVTCTSNHLSRPRMHQRTLSRFLVNVLADDSSSAQLRLSLLADHKHADSILKASKHDGWQGSQCMTEELRKMMLVAHRSCLLS